MILQWLDDLGKSNAQIEYSFPEPSLLDDLVHLYFLNVHPYSPILHQPTFERLLNERLHHRDESFGGVVLIVCALGARHVNDPRVILEGTNSWQSSGWKWFSQVSITNKSLISYSRLYDLQIACVSRVVLNLPTSTRGATDTWQL